MQRPSHTFRAQREFGLLVGGILLGFGLWWIYRGKFAPIRLPFVAVGGLLVAFGTLWPWTLDLPYRAWMGLAEGLSKVVTAIVLFLVYFFVVTPIGIVKRLSGWDPLGRRAAGSDSYWVAYSERQHDPRHFEKMF
jgi:hypothetical protein